MDAAEQQAGSGEVAPRGGHGWALAAVLIVYLLLAGSFVRLLPLWGAVHDEPLHYGYCKYLVVRGHFPLIGESNSGDPRFFYRAPSAGEAAHHPPAYYLLGSLVIRLFASSSMATQNYAVRALSVLLCLLALPCIYGLVREMLPDDPWAAVVVTAGVGVFPHWLLMASVIYVESLGCLAGAFAMWMVAAWWRDRRVVRLLGAGAAVGLLALTKLTLLPLGVALTGVLAAMVWQAQLPRREQLRAAGAFLGAALAVAGWWYVRNLTLYGKLFPTSVQPGELATCIRYGGQPGDLLTMLFDPSGRFYYKLALEGTFRYFWGPDDWLPAGLRTPMFVVAALTWLLPAVGLYRGLKRRDADFLRYCRTWLAPFAVAYAMLYYAYLKWTLITAIQAKAELGKFVSPWYGFFWLSLLLTVGQLVGRRRAVWVAAAFVGFFVVWDCLAYHNLATVLIPRYAGTIPVP